MKKKTNSFDFLFRAEAYLIQSSARRVKKKQIHLIFYSSEPKPALSKEKNRLENQRKVPNKVVIYVNFVYICDMKEELGKWFLDIAKYMTTAVLLASLFSGISEWAWYMYGVIVLAILVTLATGLTLLKDKKEGK